jgi:hypothetical protein
MSEKHILVKLVDAIDWWSQRRNRWPTTTEAFKQFDIIQNRDSLEILSEWWSLAEEIYKDHLKTPRELTTKDDRAIAILMGNLIYSEYDGEPSGKYKSNREKEDQTITMQAA